MKRIEVILKPHKLEDVREALEGLGLHGLTVTSVSGFGRQQGHTEVYRGSEYSSDFVPKTKLEIVVEDDMAEEVVRVIRDSGWTGKIGDGKIFVSPLEEAMRIRTGERGGGAL